MVNSYKVIQNILDNNIIKSYSLVEQAINQVRERLEDNEFRIAVVGEFSSGKSTFINALLGKDILKHATVETTASITYIHNVKKSNELCGKCKVDFYKGESKILDNYSDLKEYTTTMSQDDVINTVECVNIYVNFMDIDEELIIIDTPGLNGVADKHREVTIEEVQRAHACIYLCQKNGITDSDREFIKFLCNYQNTFLFIQNFIDELKESEGETVEDKLRALRRFLDENIIGNENLKIDCSLYGISALKGLVGKDETIKKLYDGEIFEITGERRKEILKQSNIRLVEEKIREISNSENTKLIRYKAAYHTIVILLEDVLKKEREIQYLNKSFLQEDKGTRDIEKAKETINNLNNKESEIIKKLENLVVSEFSRKKKLLSDDIEEKIKVILENIVIDIDNEQIYEEFNKKYSNNYYVNEIQRYIDLYKKDLEKSEYCVIQDTYRKMLNRLSEYSRYNLKGIKTLREVKLLQSKSENLDIKFPEKRDEIESIKKNLRDLKYDERKASEDLIRLKCESKRYLTKYKANKIKLSELDRKKDQDVKLLGGRPQKFVDGYDTTEYYEERSGFWGRIAQSLLGSKKKTKSIPRYNDSKGLNWDKSKRNIERKYQEDKEALNKEIILLKERQFKIEEDIDSNKSIEENSIRQIKYLNSQIQYKENELKIYETKAKKEYLNMRKNQLKNDISRYLLEGNGEVISILDLLRGKMISDMEKNESIIVKEVKTECKRYIKSEYDRLNSMILGSEEELNKKYKLNEDELISLEEIYNSIKGELGNE